MRLSPILVLAPAIFWAGSALAQAPKAGAGAAAPQLSARDKAFVDYAAQDNQAEIELCILAEKKAKDPAVKAFARLMVDDHVEVESRLASLINAENVTVPNGPGKEGRETFDKLDALDGQDFDGAFLRAQISDHKNDIKRYDDERSNTDNALIQNYASETAPLLQQHLRLAEAVQDAGSAAERRPEASSSKAD